ncbi:hypothetical protein COM83_34235, partial [Bacillus cereus]
FNIQIPNGVAEAATFEMYMNGQKKGHQGPEIFSQGRKNWSGHVYGFGVHIGDAINGNNTFELKVKGNVVSTFRGKLFTDEEVQNNYQFRDWMFITETIGDTVREYVGSMYFKQIPLNIAQEYKV